MASFAAAPPSPAITSNDSGKSNVVNKDPSLSAPAQVAVADVTYNSEDDLDYHPDEDEGEDDEDYEEEDTEDDDYDDDSRVFDKSIQKNGVCSSSSSVSLEQNEDQQHSKLSIEQLAEKLQSQTSELDLQSHKRFKAFVHKHEIPRKFLHVSIGFVTLYFYTLNSSTQIFVPYLSTACAIIFSLDLLRFKFKNFNKAYCNVVGFLMREKEVNSYNGVIWYLLGLTIAFKPFPKDIGVMAVLLLSWSDTAASTIGRAYGYLTPKIAGNKSLAGSIAAFITGAISCLIFYGYFIPTYKYTDDIIWSPEKSHLNLAGYSVACGFIAALSEGIDILNWDDNFTIPTLSSIFLYSLVRATEIR